MTFSPASLAVCNLFTEHFLLSINMPTIGAHQAFVHTCSRIMFSPLSQVPDQPVHSGYLTNDIGGRFFETQQWYLLHCKKFVKFSTGVGNFLTINNT